jgi:hypothetical protein
VTLFGHRLAAAYRIRHCRTALRRHPSPHGRRMKAGLRFRTACRPSPVRQRLFPHHHGRAFPDLRSCAGGRRPYGWVKAIREQIKNGVDHIKLNLSGSIMGRLGTSTPIRSCSTTRSAPPSRSATAWLQGHGARHQPGSSRNWLGNPPDCSS